MRSIKWAGLQAPQSQDQWPRSAPTCGPVLHRQPTPSSERFASKSKDKQAVHLTDSMSSPFVLALLCSDFLLVYAGLRDWQGQVGRV